MNSAFLRLFVAVAAFVLSVGLTSVVKLFQGGDARMSPVEISRWREHRPKVEFPVDNFEADRMQLLEFYHEYGPAQTRHDRAFFERLETEDFTLFLGEQHLSREDDIRWMENLPSEVVYESYADSVEILGDWAIAHGRMQARHVSGHMHSWGFIDVWVRRGDTWRIQSTTAID